MNNFIKQLTILLLNYGIAIVFHLQNYKNIDD